jgi:hypothetical protein
MAERFHAGCGVARLIARSKPSISDWPTMLTLAKRLGGATVANRATVAFERHCPEKHQSERYG